MHSNYLLKRLFAGSFLGAFLLVGCSGSGNTEHKATDQHTFDYEPERIELTFEHKGVFSHTMESVLEKYYDLKDVLVESDSTGAVKLAEALYQELEAIPDSIVPEQELLRWRHHEQSLFDALSGISDVRLLEEQRTAFKKLSTTLYTVLTEIGTEDIVVYQQYCPMAFNDLGAYWLSDKQEVLNPYFGDKMLRCGYVREILSFK